MVAWSARGPPTDHKRTSDTHSAKEEHGPEFSNVLQLELKFG